jgi:mono/diheme cytochrome c family protein
LFRLIAVSQTAIVATVAFLGLAGCFKVEERAPARGAAQSSKPAKESERSDGLDGFATAAASLQPVAASLTPETLYQQNCAGCHGERGDGKGIAAAFLFPKPRDFRAGNFRLVTTENGVPTIEDLEAVIQRGMPGSSMPPWPQFSTEDRRGVAQYVFQLRREGARDVERALAAEDEIELTPEELEQAIEPVTTPGPMIEVPPLPAADSIAIQRGQELYRTKGCAACHGNEGRGDGQQQMVDAEGLPTRPRDLTRGLFKGNPDPASVYRRILAGMPGTPMPALRNVSHEEIADLVSFVLSLSDDATREAAVPRRHHLVAQAIPNISDDPGAPVWNSIVTTRLRTIPLWWRDDADPWVDVQCAHDGETLAVRLSWSNPWRSESAIRHEEFQDAVAIELFQGEREPFLGMGNREAPVEVWMWGADRNGERGDVETINPNVVVDQYPISEQLVDTAEYRRPGTATADQAKLTLSAVFAGNQITPLAHPATASALEAAGPGSITFRPPINQIAKGKGVWQQGRWSVVLSRPLRADGEEGMTLTPGGRLSIAVAVWDGHLRDRNGQKRVTIWQELELQPFATRSTAKE